MSDTFTIDKKNSFADTLLDIFTIALLAVTFIPQFRLISWINYLQLILCGSWILLAFSSHLAFFLGENKYFLKSFACLLILLLIPFMFSNDTMVNRASSIIGVLIFYWIYSYNTAYRGLKSNIRIVCVSFVFVLYTTINTIRALIVNPYASRSMKTDVESTADIVSSGVGSYSLIYSVVLFTLILVPLLIDWRKLKFNMIKLALIVGLIIIFLYLIILSNYFTALIISVIGGVTIFLSYRSVNVLFFIIPLSLIYFTMQKEINIAVIDTISSFSQENGKTYIRLQETKRGIETGEKGENINSRSGVMETSLDLVSEYPIIGYIAGAGSQFELSRVGQHSTILDTFAMYGIFIGTFFFWIMWLPFKSLISRRSSYRMNVLVWIVGISFMILITFNNLTPSMGYAAFFVLPTAFDYLKRNIYGKG